MKNNEELQKDVQNAISWEPSMHAAEVGVTAKDGVVTLSGIVNNLSKKLNAERATSKVAGVRAIVENISVDYGSSTAKTDKDIANDILKTWERNSEVPEDKITVTVENGWVNIGGEVAWKYQQEAAHDTIDSLAGIIGIKNNVIVKSESSDSLEKMDIEHAFGRNWSISPNDIHIEVNHDRVRLTGTVHSLYQKIEAGRLAWGAAGVQSVQNDLNVDLLLQL